MPPLIKLDHEDLLILSNEFNYKNKQEEWDDSLEDKISLRKCCKNLFSQFIYYLNELPILDFIYNEINNLQNEETYEALLYMMCGILKNIDSIMKD